MYLLLYSSKILERKIFSIKDTLAIEITSLTGEEFVSDQNLNGINWFLADVGVNLKEDQKIPRDLIPQLIPRIKKYWKGVIPIKDFVENYEFLNGEIPELGYSAWQNKNEQNGFPLYFFYPEVIFSRNILKQNIRICPFEKI